MGWIFHNARSDHSLLQSRILHKTTAILLLQELSSELIHGIVWKLPSRMFLYHLVILSLFTASCQILTETSSDPFRNLFGRAGKMPQQTEAFAAKSDDLNSNLVPTWSEREVQGQNVVLCLPCTCCSTHVCVQHTHTCTQINKCTNSSRNFRWWKKKNQEISNIWGAWGLLKGRLLNLRPS